MRSALGRLGCGLGRRGVRALGGGLGLILGGCGLGLDLGGLGLDLGGRRVLGLLGNLSAAFSAAFLAGAFFFLACVASPDGAPSAAASAALKRSSLDGLGSLTFSVPSAPGRPLNFCQSPVIFSSCSTGSVGWAPTPSQYWARSESISMTLGSSFG